MAFSIDIGAFSGRNYRSKRRNYALSICSVLAEKPGLRFTQIIDEVALREQRISYERRIKSKLKGRISETLDKLSQLGYIIEREKYSREGVYLTYKGLFSILFVLNLDDNPYRNEIFSIPIPIDEYMLENMSYNFGPWGLEDLIPKLDYLSYIVPRSIVVFVWLYDVSMLIEGNNVDKVPASFFEEMFVKGVKNSHALAIRLMRSEELLRFVNTDFHDFKRGIDKWLNGFDISCASRFPQIIRIKDGEIRFNKLENALLDFLETMPTRTV